MEMILLAFLGALSVTSVTSERYLPNWASLDTHPLPQWYDDAKFGIFIHWGVFSVPSYGPAVAEWFWYNWKFHHAKPYVDFMKANYRPGFTYADFASQFTAEFYDPDQWADIFKSSGARYIVLTSKHHEGFCNWPSKVSFNWNAMAVGPKRDLVGGLATAIRKRTSLHLGLYHSLFEWFNPVYLNDKKNNFTTQDFVRGKTMPELYELVNAYKPDIVWSDGHIGPDVYWNSTQFIAWLYNDSPVKDTVVVNDRWGNNDIVCKHGDIYTCTDNYNPGHLLGHKWENCMSVDSGSWGFRRNAHLSNYNSIEKLLQELTETVSCGGNLLLNVGPTHDGRIIPVLEERLRQMGSWLKVNGEAIYSSKPWTHQNDTLTKHVWYTSQRSPKGTVVYAILLQWPETDTLTLGAPVATPSTTVTMLGYKTSFKFTKLPSKGIQVHIPAIPINKMPCLWAWVLKLQNVSS